ncbi:hypothetical protein PG995_013932 [Apiospora arundinis]
MFRAIVKRTLNDLTSRPAASKATWLPRLHLRMTGSPPHARLNFYSRQVNQGGTKKRTVALMAGLGTTTVVAALAASSIGAAVPEEYVEEVSEALRKGFESNSVTAFREAQLLSTRLWLNHYFWGDFLDEGTLGRDLVIFDGVYILDEDTRVLYLPAENAAIIPVVCVSINHALRITTLSDLDMGKIDAPQNGQSFFRGIPKYLLALTLMQVLRHLDEHIVSKMVAGRSVQTMLRHTSMGGCVVATSLSGEGWKVLTAFDVGLG